MGMFTFIKSDTGKKLRYGAPCKLIMPNDYVYHEDSYDGYGRFAGQDYFVLLAECNGYHMAPDKSDFDVIREIGLEFFYDHMDNDNEDLLFPKVVGINYKGRNKDLPRDTLKVVQ